MTVLIQRGAIRAAEEIPFTLRTGNAVASYAIYLRDLVYPANLAVFYPFPAKGVPLAQIVLALVFLSAVSAAAVWWRRSRPCFLVGWLWYLGMLVPVIGLLQVGTQARADRYTYLSQIGLYVLLTWAIAGLAASRRQWRWIF